MNILDRISAGQGSLSVDDDGGHAVLLNNINGIYFLMPIKTVILVHNGYI